jgi:hypothetical protein
MCTLQLRPACLHIYGAPIGSFATEGTMADKQSTPPPTADVGDDPIAFARICLRSSQKIHFSPSMSPMLPFSASCSLG